MYTKENDQPDLLDNYEVLPEEVQQILSSYNDEDSTYDTCRALEKELNAVGYGIDWGLDAVPYDLHKL